MTNSALNTRIATSANLAVLSQVDFVERCGVVLCRSEYTQPAHVPAQTPAVNTKDAHRVAFVVRLDGGIGSEIVTIDQTLDAVTALIRVGDQVSAKIRDDLHVESTVEPIFSWGAPTDELFNGQLLRAGEFVDVDGVKSIASLILTDDTGELKICVTRSLFNKCDPSFGSVSYFTHGADSLDRVGVVLKRSEYTRARHIPATTPLIGTSDRQRVVFIVRLDGGIGSELITIDQTLDAVSALIEEGDQVQVNIVRDAHIESTVQPVFGWGSAAHFDAHVIASGDILRSGKFRDSKGVPSTAQLVLAKGAGLVVNVHAH